MIILLIIGGLFLLGFLSAFYRVHEPASRSEEETNAKLLRDYLLAIIELEAKGAEARDQLRQEAERQAHIQRLKNQSR